MRVLRTLLLLLGLASVAACSSTPPTGDAPASPAGKIALAAPPAMAAPVEDLSGLPRSFTVNFDFDSAEIRASAMQVLWEAAQVANKLKPVVIRVRGFTDAAGSRAYNQKLSERRAAAVAAQLVKLGVAVASVDARGLASTRPAVEGKRREARNRRVELTLEGGLASLPVPQSARSVSAGMSGSIAAATAFQAPPVTVVMPRPALLAAGSHVDVGVPSEAWGGRAGPSQQQAVGRPEQFAAICPTVGMVTSDNTIFL